VARFIEDEEVVRLQNPGIIGDCSMDGAKDSGRAPQAAPERLQWANLFAEIGGHMFRVGYFGHVE
jgi:hypothetical protein